VKESIYSVPTGGLATLASGGSYDGPARVVTVDEANVGISRESNLLLVDMREKDDYNQWHIKDAVHFSYIAMRQDKTFPELLNFRNKAEKYIVIYMGDERQGIQVADAIVDRGYENTYLLTGGIEKFLPSYESLVEGTNVPKL